MKKALSWLLTLALLMHGAVAAAMGGTAVTHARQQVEMQAAQADLPPCHQQEQSQVASCCDQGCAYQVFCGGAVVQSGFPLMTHPQPVSDRQEPVRPAARSAHRSIPLRPPISLSA